MKAQLVCFLAALVLVTGATTAQAKHKDKDKYYKHSSYDRYDRDDRYGRGHYGGSSYRDRSRTIYVIERNRPVQRVVYLAPDGRYYRTVSGRRVYVSGRYYTSYPSR